jgi:hypothetical protein
MRRLVFPIIVASGLVLVGAGSASVAPTPAAGAAKAAVPGKKVCKIADPRLDELSGLVATKNGFITVDDSASQASHKRIFYLDTACKVVNQVKYSGKGPRDTEDMALSPDGKTLWVGDIGDNDKVRPNLGLWKMPADGSKSPVLYRVRYPAGEGPFDAEGLMINGDGNPIVVTKEANKVSLFVPTGTLKPGETDGVLMKRAADLKLPSSTTDNPLGLVGRLVATGAAVSPDRSKLVIRTYADAFEFPVSDDNLVAAVKGTPTATPLPNEPQGESISYSPDGKYLYTVSDMQGNTGGAENDILRYTPAARVTAAKTAGTAAGTTTATKKASWFSKLSLDDITYLVGAVGVLGAILVGFGIFGIVRSRRRPPRDPAAVGDDYPNGPTPLDAETELLTVGGPPNGQRPGTYGAQQPGTYGRPGGPQRGNAVYGGGPANGRPGPGGAQPGGRPGQGGGRSGQGGQPGGRPGQGGQPMGRPGQGQPGGRPGQGGQPGGRPGQGGQPGGRPGQGGQPTGRPGQGGQPGGRPGQGGQPTGRPGQGGQPGGRPGSGAGGQGGGRPAGGGGAQPSGRPTRGGVYGVPPSGPPPGRGGQAGPSQRSSGYHPDGGRQSSQGGGYADVNGPGRGRDYDNPGYGRPDYDR